MCDIILASPTAVFGQPEINLGVIPGGGGTQRLAHAIGKSRTMELVLTGRNFSAVEAESWGVVSRVVDEGEGWDGLGGMGGGRVGACFFADQQLDRSPTGSGVSARVALARAKGVLGDGERVRFDSLLSARAGGAAGAFVGSAVPGGRVLVEGRAFYTGACAFVVEDAFSRGGFLL